MLINREKAIAAVDKHYDEMWRSRQYHQAEGNEESVGRLDARCRTASQIAEALRSLPTDDGVTDEMVEAAAKAICYDAIQMGDAHGVVMSRVNAAWKEYRQVARLALEAALGPLPAPPTIE